MPGGRVCVYNQTCVERAAVRVLEEEGGLRLPLLHRGIIQKHVCPDCQRKLYTKNGLDRHALTWLLHTSPLFAYTEGKPKVFLRSSEERAFRFLFRDFSDGASEILYGPPWRRSRQENFSPIQFEYMRTIRESDGITYMVVFDVDNKDELTQDLLDGVFGLYDSMGRIGALKASGTGGLHYMPCYFQFPIGTDEGAAVASLDAWAETTLRERMGVMGYQVSYGKDKAIRLQGGENSKVIDDRMFERSRKVRGFCARFNKTGSAYNSTGLYSVPIDRADDIDSVKRKMKLEIPLTDKFRIPVFLWSGELLKADKRAAMPTTREYRRYTSPKGEEELNEMFQEYWRIMPRRLKAVWTTPDPDHEENFAVAAWLNLQMVDKEMPLEERIGLVIAFINRLMPRESYRATGKQNPDITAVQVRQICSRNEGKGYMPPGWVWEKP